MGLSLLVTGLLLYVLAAAGCGSNESSPAARQSPKPAANTKPQVIEITPDTQRRVPVALKPLLRQPESDEVEVIPPDYPGGRGLTAAEVKARILAAPQAVNPEVIPPDRPGRRGLTNSEVKAKVLAAARPVNPEVIPPDQPGGRGLTAAEVDAVRPRPQEVKPAYPGVPPPSEPR